MDKLDLRTLRTMFGVAEAVQLCYCGSGATALPDEPVTDHNLGCLVWDWAVAVRKVTPAQRMEQVSEYDKSLGKS
jgi:hypothetical protein